ncbi:hypothetical protein DJ533_10640 [Acinetobacter defluvii]|uniref:SH3 domain-containing protein n=1 Tax=Acinetobacter defluvii TaxID=1871111 RepID=A0A2S2FDD8_9GAMM|nr:hypothetical protein [Acinetobacter defluvii]AWL28991.1 hypothetical protein DJ533_10640 [Acinetobacter defluvii]
MKKSTIGWGFAGVVGLGALFGGDDTPNTNQNTKEPVIEERFVNTAILNVRDKPNGKILSKKQRGNSVSIYEINNGWARIADNSLDPEWVFFTSLCKGEGCYIVKSEIKKQNFVHQRNANSIPSVSNNSASYSNSYDSDCSCAVVDYCVGPRGGHYCITSSGNKRYLQR